MNMFTYQWTFQTSCHVPATGPINSTVVCVCMLLLLLLCACRYHPEKMIKQLFK